jgi:acyl carrier protein
MTEHVTPRTDDLSQRVREIVIQELEIEPGELDEAANFVDDYDADSLSLITVVARIDKELRISLPQDIQPELVNLERVIAAVLSASSESSDG